MSTVIGDAPDEPVSVDVHDLEPGSFAAEVYGFDFWFQSVEGYLHDSRHGRVSGPEEVDARALDAQLDQDERDRLTTVLSHYLFGETAALEASSGLVALAPNRASKIFLATQVVDEARHLDVFTHRLEELGVSLPEAEAERRAAPPLRVFKKRLLELVHSGDWDAAILAQNVILEAMEFSVFQAHLREADPVTAQLLASVIKDERRHMGFGENDLGRRIRNDASVARRLERIERELSAMVLDTFEHTLGVLDVAEEDRVELVRGYLAVIERVGLRGS